MELFKLLGTIAIENSDANSSIDETSGKVDSFSSKLVDGIETAAKWGTAIVAGTAAAATALVGFATSSASTADNIDKMSQKIGISREAYQELDFICSQSGTSVDTLQAGIKSLTSAMDGAASGTASNVEQFEKLGISVTDANGNLRSQEDVMWETLSALQGMENQTEKARLATELFGRSGTELMPLLNGASGSIEEMKQQAHDLGLVLDDELIDNGVNLTDSLDQTKRAFQSIITQLGGSLMPIVEQASDYIQKSLPYIQDLVGRLSPILTSMLDSILPPLMDLAEQIFPVLFDMIEKILPSVTEIVESILPIIIEIIQTLIPPMLQIVDMILPVLVELVNALLPIIQAFMPLLEPILNLLLVIAESLIQFLSEILPPLIEKINGVVNVLVAFLVPAINKTIEFVNSVKKTISNAMSSIRTTISTVFNTIKSTISSVLNTIKSTVSSVFNAVKSTISSVFNGIWSTTVSIWNAVKDAIVSPIETAKNMISGILDTISGLFSSLNISFPSIPLPHFAISPAGWKIGDLLKGSIPSLSIEWYAKAMNNPMIMEQATAFGVNGNGQIMAGGEKGSEVVSGTETLMKMISQAVAEQNGALIAVLTNILDAILNMDDNMGGNLCEAIAGTSLKVNNREFARLVKAVN